MTVLLPGILLALACALASSVAFLCKHRGACAAAPVDPRRPLRSARALYSSRWFALGMAIALGAWLLHVGALALAPISTVQTVLAAGVVALAALADRAFGLRVGQRQWWGVALTAAALVLLVIALPAARDAGSRYSSAGMIAFEAGLLALGALLIAAPRFGSPAHHHGVMLGAAAGVLFGVSDVAIKGLTGLFAEGGPAGLLSPWLGTALLASVIAFYASARGLQKGEAVPVIVATGTTANVSGIAGGLIVFGDPLPSTTFGAVLVIVAFGMVCAATALVPAPRIAA